MRTSKKAVLLVVLITIAGSMAYLAWSNSAIIGPSVVKVYSDGPWALFVGYKNSEGETYTYTHMGSGNETYEFSGDIIKANLGRVWFSSATYVEMDLFRGNHLIFSEGPQSSDIIYDLNAPKRVG